MNAELLQGFYLKNLLVEPLTGKVTGPSGNGQLGPRAAEVLVQLASSPGEVVGRDTLLDEVWGEGQGSTELLSRAVSEIRHALDDHPDNPAFIQTLPRRGYRLIVTPESVDESTSSIVLGVSHGARTGDIGILENLQQRGVFETAIAYVVLGWVLLQAADVVFSQLHMPSWIGTFVTVLVFAGFPIALVLSWFIEIRRGNAVLDNLSAADKRRRRLAEHTCRSLAHLHSLAYSSFSTTSTLDYRSRIPRQSKSLSRPMLSLLWPKTPSPCCRS